MTFSLIDSFIQLPDLKTIELDTETTFRLRLALIKYNEDPSSEQHLHYNQLEYHSDDAQRLEDGTVTVLITAKNAQEGKMS